MTDLLLSLVMLGNLVLLGTSRIHVCIQVAALQGLALSLLPAFVHHHGFSLRLVALVGVTALVKGFVVPALLRRALAQLRLRLEVEPYIGYGASMVAGAAVTAGAVLLADRLPLLPQHAGSLLVPASLATLFTGFLLLTTRVKALTQVVGYLVLENGIFVFSLLLLADMSTPIELGLLLDLFAGIFVMGIVINHIQRTFSTLDTRQLSELKE